MRNFPSSLDRRTLAMTVLAAAFLVIGISAAAVSSAQTISPARELLIALAVALALALVVAYLLAPSGVSVDPTSLWLNRRLSREQLALTDLRSVRRINSLDLRNAVRLFGVGGLFGYYGWFTSSALGRFRMVATRLDRLAVADFAGKTIVFSADEIDTVVAALQRC